MMTSRKPARRATNHASHVHSWLEVGSITLAIAALSFSGTRGQAATVWWDGTGTAWSTLSSWGNTANSTTDPASIPGGADIATFSIAAVTTAQTVDLGTADQSALGLVFLGTNPSATVIQGGGTDRTLTLSTSGITVNSSAGAVTIGSSTAGQNVAITIAGPQL